ncbi:MAG: hypothetical protein OEV44_12115 [Spirochaetota bacterium]|nr:hypothetical protein [Spirochaetota bacterium]
MNIIFLIKQNIIISVILLSIWTLGCSKSEILNPNDEKTFIEIFHALEIDYNKSSNDENAIYLDYIIQKYQLWKAEQLKKYIDSKDHFRINEEKWKTLLNKAQDFQKDPDWNTKLKEIEDKTEGSFLKEIEKSNPDFYKLLNILKDGKTDEIEKVFNTIFPNSKFPKENWNSDLSKTWFRKAIRKMLRNNFKLEAQKLNI